MNHFESDYVNGALPQVLQALIDTNNDSTVGYSMDPYCDQARELIRSACSAPEAEVHFLVGGTQTNTTVIASALRPYQGVLCADSGHINVHETGAIEATGHKVLALRSQLGKISAQQIKDAYLNHINDGAFEHIVQPGMVYISQPTEIGTLYSLKELSEISSVCHECGLPLFVDGARLGYALTAPDNDVALADLARLCDVFYIGGTKCGLLFGEAVVFSNKTLAREFRYSIKQRGGMLAKGRLLGIQFSTLFTDGLYYTACKNAMDHAVYLKSVLAQAGIPVLVDSPTNQQFPILSKAQQEYLSKRHVYEYWCPVDAEHDVIRFCTSWSTTAQAMAELAEDLLACKGL